MSGLDWLVGLGAALLAAGAVAPVLGLRDGALGLQALGIALLGAAGAAVLLGSPAIGAEFQNGLGPALGIDGLSGFFLATIAIVAVPSLLYARDGLRGDRAPALIGLSGLFLASLCGVVTARDPLSLLAWWELMTLVPAVAILVRDSGGKARHAVFVYLGVTHLGGAGAWISVLALAHYGALSDPGSIVVAQGAGTQALLIVAAIVGFGTKAGLMPLHTWLPRAHPVAPSHVSALMSGVMIKVALYGLIRVLFEWAGPAPLWAGLAVLAIGLLSALGGVLYALVQHDLKRLLAFHSIENVGIVALGLGASILFASEGRSTWAALAFGAALLHVLNHAVFKALLFLAAGAFERAVGSLDLDRLGGLLRRMPWIGGAFLIGSMAIAGVPPLNGFASEWLTLQALVHAALGPSLGIGLAGAVATAGLAATAALALLCFAKVVGLVLLGPPRQPRCADAADSPAAMRLATAFLAACCVALGAAPGLLVPSLMELSPQPSSLDTVPALLVPGTGNLPSPWLALGLAGLTLLLWRARGARRSAPVPAWACGQAAEPALLWTSAGFTKPLRLVLEPVLRPSREISVEGRPGAVRKVSYSSESPHLFDTAIYRPLRRHAVAAAGVVRRIQSGSVRAYAAYLLVLVLALLALVRAGAIG